MSDRNAQIAAWQTVRDVVMEHLALRRAEVHARLGLSFTRVKALGRLAGGRLSMGELAAALDTDPPYTSVIVDDLVQRQLVVRSADPDDRRRKLVGLTAAGAEYASTAESILGQPPEGFASLGAAELGALTAAFRRLGHGAVTTR
ncbi:MarR family winged helix-turn-helix transcriptional regulator [Nakamurella sp. PAMC28650]|uniref:MarR family winged helix-turn-helix transcriptional regulator n=1 Tax=Nakamurella sp. PAMC28650 TaxID=2762325 RepID=UPI00164E8FA9|nr:MarR family transcriptional regulator [Nakamurella sp. PAMC28650]QNK80166.1 MarR family transcriptional regulator [Nakamurella sp. PAMC28650]